MDRERETRKRSRKIKIERVCDRWREINIERDG